MSWPFDNASIRHDKQFQSKYETSIKHLATQTTLRQVTAEVKPCTSDASRLQIWQILTRKRSQQHAPKSNNRWNKKTYTLKQACCQGYPESTICVQVPVGSRNSAIHNAYRTSLRPSSLIEPRHPSLKVVNKVTSWCTIVFERIASTPRQQERR